MMMSDISALNAPLSDYILIKLLFAFFLILNTIAWIQSGPMKFYYNNKNQLLNDFLEKTNIRKMKYTPNVLGLWHFGQSFTYVAF